MAQGFVEIGMSSFSTLLVLLVIHAWPAVPNVLARRSEYGGALFESLVMFCQIDLNLLTLSFSCKADSPSLDCTWSSMSSGLVD
jgi:hypothetical protein